MKKKKLPVQLSANFAIPLSHCIRQSIAFYRGQHATLFISKRWLHCQLILNASRSIELFQPSHRATYHSLTILSIRILKRAELQQHKINSIPTRSPLCTEVVATHHSATTPSIDTTISIAQHSILHYSQPHKIKKSNPTALLPLRVEVAKVDALLLAAVDARYGAGNLPCNKSWTTARALVIEQDTVCQVHAIGLTELRQVTASRVGQGESTAEGCEGGRARILNKKLYYRTEGVLLTNDGQGRVGGQGQEMLLRSTVIGSNKRHLFFFVCKTQKTNANKKIAHAIVFYRQLFCCICHVNSLRNDCLLSSFFFFLRFRKKAVFYPNEQCSPQYCRFYWGTLSIVPRVTVVHRERFSKKQKTTYFCRFVSAEQHTCRERKARETLVFVVSIALS